MDDFPKNKLKGFALIEILIALTVVAVFCSVDVVDREGGLQSGSHHDG